MADAPLTPIPLIEMWPDQQPRERIARLAAVGLADAFTWVRTPDELSVGQLARLRLALALWSGAGHVHADEWLNALDRVTARAVAWATGRILRQQGIGAILVTSQDDIVADLQPDLVLRVGWQCPVEVERPATGQPACSVLDELVYERGTTADWQAVKPLHYAAGNPGTYESIHVLRHPALRQPAAVAVLSYPDLHSSARNLALGDEYATMRGKNSTTQLNRDVLKLTRVVVTPELRGCGVARDLIARAISSSTARYIECVTAMGRYSGFLRSCGFREVPQATSDVEAAINAAAVMDGLPDQVALSADALASWAAGLSVRRAREWRRLAWGHFHHFVVHRRTRRPPPRKIPNPGHPLWPEAWAILATRLHERPSYWVLGPIDRMTGLPEVDARGHDPRPDPGQILDGAGGPLAGVRAVSE